MACDPAGYDEVVRQTSVAEKKRKKKKTSHCGEV